MADKERIEPFLLTLFQALEDNDTESVETYYTSGFNIDDRLGRYGTTALMAASLLAKPRIVSYCLENGAKVDMTDSLLGSTALFYAVENTQFNKRVVEILASHEAKINFQRQVDLHTPLHHCIEFGSWYAFLWLLSHGADIKLVTDTKSTSLHLAVKRRNIHMVRTLISKKADVKAVDCEGWTVLHMCCCYVNLDIAACLLAAGVDVNARTLTDRTPLMFAASSGDKALCETLIAAGANVDCVDADGDTALMTAVTEAKISIVQLLLSKGADPEIANKERMTPIEVAHWKQHKDVYRVLLAHYRKEYPSIVTRPVTFLDRIREFFGGQRRHRFVSIPDSLVSKPSTHKTNIVVKKNTRGTREAVKSIPVSNNYNAERISDSVVSLSEIEHRNIIAFHYFIVAPSYVEVSMEYVDGSPLSDIVSSRNDILPYQTVNQYSKEILEGLSFLHINKQVHGYLNTSHVIITLKNTVKLIGFGLGRLDDAVCRTAYCAPEVLDDCAISHKSDVWATGCILFEMCTRQPPFASLAVQTLKSSSHLSKMPSLPANTPKNLKETYSNCTVFSAERRRPAADILLDHF